MIADLILDEEGRIKIPDSMQAELHIGPGDKLKVETSADKIMVQAEKESGTFRRVNGTLVYKTGEPLEIETINDVINKTREERDLRNLYPEQ